MTILGKFFTVLVFVLSAVFMAFSVMVFVTHKNWRDYATNVNPNNPGLYQKLQQQKDLAEQLQRKLQEQQNALAAEQAARQYVLAVMQTKVTQLESDLSQSERKFTDLIAANGKASEALASNTESLGALTQQVSTLRTEVRDTQQDRNEKFMIVVAQTDELNQAKGVEMRLEERGKQLAGQVTQFKHLLTTHGIDMQYPPKNVPPKLYGIVRAVNKGDLVEISIGQDDGLKEGHELDVYRNNQYIGRIVIRKTTPDASVGQLIPKFMKDRIREGDNVTTKFG